MVLWFPMELIAAHARFHEVKVHVTNYHLSAFFAHFEEMWCVEPRLLRSLLNWCQIFYLRYIYFSLAKLQSGINMEYIGETHQALEQELDYQTFLEDELKNYVARVG